MHVTTRIESYPGYEFCIALGVVARRARLRAMTGDPIVSDVGVERRLAAYCIPAFAGTTAAGEVAHLCTNSRIAISLNVKVVALGSIRQASSKAGAEMSDQVFYTKPSKMIRGALFCFLIGACGAYGIYDLYLGFAFGKHTDARAWAAALCILGLPLSPVFLFEAVRRYPKLTISNRGLRLERTFRSTWAGWDSLGPFETMTIREKIRLAKAPVLGPNTDARTQKTRVFVIPDCFDLPFSDLVARINAHILATESRVSKSLPLAS